MQLGSKLHTFPLLAGIHRFMELSQTSPSIPPLATPQTIPAPTAASQTLRLGVIDKLPSSMQFTPAVVELHLDAVPFSAFSAAVNQAVAMARVRALLQDNVGKLLDAFPSGWRKVRS